MAKATKKRRVAAPHPNGWGLLGNAAWETMKASRENIDPDQAVQTVFYLQQQYRRQWSDRMAASPVDLYEIIRTLTEKRIPFVLTGAHGIASWTGRPRNTLDIDILVKPGRNLARAVKAVRALYPNLEVRDFAGVMAFFMPGEKQSVIDITYPHRADLAETLENPVWTENKELGLRYRIPALEMALANKYGAMMAITRDSRKRRQDVLDFEYMVLHSTDEGQRPIDLSRLEQLGEKVWPGGGGKEILKIVEQVKAGKAITLESLGM